MDEEEGVRVGTMVDVVDADEDVEVLTGAGGVIEEGKVAEERFCVAG